MNLDLLIPIAFISLFGGIFILSILSEKKRSKNLTALAERLHMDYTNKPDQTELAAYALFELFSRGRSKKMAHLMTRSSNDLRTSCFDYRYTTGSGKNSSTHRQSVVAVYNPAAPLPTFILQPENVFHRIADKFNDQDIDFDAHPEFSKMFLLKGEDEAEIRKLFSDQVVRRLEQFKGLCIETRGDQIIFYKRSKRCSVKNIEQFIADALTCYGMLINAD